MLQGLVLRAAWVPLAGLGMGCVGALYGSYSLSRNATWMVFGKSEWTKDKATTRAGVATACLTAAAVVGVRELGFLPDPVPAPTLTDPKPTFLRVINHSFAVMVHTARHFPYRFRAISMFSAGALAGVASVFGEKAYSERSAKRKAQALMEAVRSAESDKAAELASLRPSDGVPMPPSLSDLPVARSNPEPQDPSDEVLGSYSATRSSANIDVVAPANDPEGIHLVDQNKLWVRDPDGARPDIAAQTQTSTIDDVEQELEQRLNTGPDGAYRYNPRD